ncbi:MAG: hypothetical protein HWE27_02720 [Gammaproteobacteria bacterium]|nr:hypothetical protein [Gammaproteobacteria bacterium]
MVYLILSIAVLAIAPLLAKWFDRSPAFEHLLSTFLLVVLGGIVLVELLPLSIQNGGWISVPLALLGLTGPSLIEKVFRKVADSTHQITLLIGFSGLLLHTMADGASLNDFSHLSSASKWLPLAIVLHRVPVALSVLWIIRPVFGFKAVWFALSTIAIFTVFGFILGVELEAAMNSSSFAWLQAFVSGTLLHVLLHRPHRHHHEHEHEHEHAHKPMPEHQHDESIHAKKTDAESHSEHTTDQNEHTHQHDEDDQKPEGTGLLEDPGHHHHSTFIEQFKHWDRYHLIGVLLGLLVLAALAILH